MEILCRIDGRETVMRSINKRGPAEGKQITNSKSEKSKLMKRNYVMMRSMALLP
jgi:hypothetical protein